MTTTHFVIPDTQVRPGVPLDHIRWIGEYIVDRKPAKVIMLGDWYDLPSLSSYDKGKAAFEGRRFRADVNAGNAALELLEGPLDEYNAERRERKEKQWFPEKHVIWGNHEDRADRAAQDNPELQGFVGTHIFDEVWRARGWNTHQFRAVIDIDGIWYTHYMSHEFTGNAMGGMAITMLKQVGHTFTQGHRQTYDLATRYVGEKMQRALIAGACYLHDEHYKGPSRDVSVRSGNHHWRGCVWKHDVQDGEYSLMELPLDFFCRWWHRKHGKPVIGLRDYMKRKYGGIVEVAA